MAATSHSPGNEDPDLRALRLMVERLSALGASLDREDVRVLAEFVRLWPPVREPVDVPHDLEALAEIRA